MTNKCEYQMEVSSRLRGSDTETGRGKGCADPRKWQQIGVGGA